MVVVGGGGIGAAVHPRPRPRYKRTRTTDQREANATKKESLTTDSCRSVTVSLPAEFAYFTTSYKCPLALSARADPPPFSRRRKHKNQVFRLMVSVSSGSCKQPRTKTAENIHLYIYIYIKEQQKQQQQQQQQQKQRWTRCTLFHHHHRRHGGRRRRSRTRFSTRSLSSSLAALYESITNRRCTRKPPTSWKIAGKWSNIDRYIRLTCQMNQR